MDVTLLTTCIVRDGIPDVLHRMLASVAANVGQHQPTRLFLLFQNCDADRLASFGPLPDFVVPLTASETMSLSAARNILLDAARKAGALRGTCLVAFPDDDCWYPEGLVGEMTGLFEADPMLEFVYCRYATKTLPATNLAGLARPASAKTVVRNASSNTLFMRGNVIEAIGPFDAMLGIGTPNNGGEDVEYALRAFIASAKSLYIPAEIVGHRDKIPGLRAKYYRGSLLALRRHAGAQMGIAVEYLRKIAVGFVLACRHDMTWRDYLASLVVTPAPLQTFDRNIETPA